MKQSIGIAFKKSIPILFSYVFLGAAYGILMQKAGFGWYYSLLISLVVYTGAFQYVLTSMMAAGTSLITIALTALFMNSRQLFYSISFVDDFNKIGKAKPYMIHSLTDETYAVFHTLDLTGSQKRQVMLYMALMCQFYWCAGAVLGGVAGSLLPFSAEGIDFCMTAQFITIFIDQWEKTDVHVSAVAGLVCGLVCLFIFGPDKFMLPSLLIVSAFLIIYDQFTKRSGTGLPQGKDS